MTDNPCPVCGKGEWETFDSHDPDSSGFVVNHLPCVQQEHERAEKLERMLEQALDTLVFWGFDAKHIDGMGWGVGQSASMRAPDGARDRLRAMLEADDEAD